jgi:hypothetical protein
MNNNVFLMAALAIVVASSVMLVGSIGVQPADASSDANCPFRSGEATTTDPNANSVNSNTPLTAQSIV